MPNDHVCSFVLLLHQSDEVVQFFRKSIAFHPKNSQIVLKLLVSIHFLLVNSLFSAIIIVIDPLKHGDDHKFAGPFVFLHLVPKFRFFIEVLDHLANAWLTLFHPFINYYLNYYILKRLL